MNSDQLSIHCLVITLWLTPRLRPLGVRCAHAQRAKAKRLVEEIRQSPGRGKPAECARLLTVHCAEFFSGYKAIS